MENDEKLTALLKTCGATGAGFADYFLPTLVNRAMYETATAYGVSAELIKSEQTLPADVANALRSGIVTTLTNCASALMSAAVSGEVLSLAEDQLDLGLIDQNEANEASGKLMAGILNSVTLTIVHNVAASVNIARQEEGKLPIFGDIADKAADDAKAAAAAAVSGVLHRAGAKKG